MTLTRREFIGAVLFTPVLLLTGCGNAENSKDERYEFLKDCYIYTYDTELGEEKMITYSEIDQDGRHCIYKINTDLEKEKLLSSSHGFCDDIYHYYEITSCESLLSSLIMKYGYQDNYTTEDIENLLNEYSSGKSNIYVK